MLAQRGTEIVDATGQEIRLRGVGLGGFMHMENFITGFPANEEAWREALMRELGPERYRFFFDRFLEYFFAEDDAAFLQSLGLNVVRVPVNYRQFERDAEPGIIREEGFKHLDRVIEVCEAHGIYTVIDLHAVQGYQNQDWHSDNPTHRAFLWSQKHFQDRAVQLWEAIGRRYRGNPWVAGYNLMNEPNDPAGNALIPFTRRLYDAVRAVDPEHLIFIDGNHYSSDFSLFKEAWPGAVYSPHDYALCGFADAGPYPGYTRDVWCDRSFLEEHFLRKTAFMREHHAPIWIGEFGPVYTGSPEVDASRYDVARDQIDIFEHYGAHWSIWTYKDIGLQGLVYVAPDSPWIRQLRPALEKKARLGADCWGGTDAEVRAVMQPLEELLAREFPNQDPLQSGAVWTATRLVRHILFAEALLPDFAACFRDLSEPELDRLLASFAFRNCIQREPLARVLMSQSTIG